MALLIDTWISVANLQAMIERANATGGKGVSLTISANDTANHYGQNVSGFLSQSKQERDAQTPKKYVTNGRVVWTDGKCPEVIKRDQPAPAATPAPAAPVSDDLPF